MFVTKVVKIFDKNCIQYICVCEGVKFLWEN